MKANEFVKKVGWERSKKAIEMSAGDFSRAFDIDMGFIIVRRGELKRLVESWELVELHGTLKLANHYALRCTCLSHKHTVDDLWKAIADVESCQ